ncbi:MAG: four helix bundle protein, partial [Alphaproteobacteria bacterium]
MPEVRSHRDLLVWQRAMDVAVSTYELTRQYPREELFGL